MIKLTRLDGSEIYINCEQIELMEETPDTHIMLSNGNRYLVLETAAMVMDRIISFKAAILHQSISSFKRKYLRKKRDGNARPMCRLKNN